MAIVFNKTQKKQQILIVVLVVVVLATAAVLLFGKFGKPPEEIIVNPDLIPLPSKEIRINFQIFDSPIFDRLEAFNDAPVFEGVSGRDNPFSLPKER
ncbi:MAG: hypothetical protein Q8N56_01155 [bacterium]|nr:hypothetical protein [bacterium]